LKQFEEEIKKWKDNSLEAVWVMAVIMDMVAILSTTIMDSITGTVVNQLTECFN
jgi:hypothetical protein